jgi:hypothetical protein
VLFSLHEEYAELERDVTIDETLLWSRSYVDGPISRNITLSYRESTDDKGSVQYFSLREDIEKENVFSMSIITILVPLDTDTYKIAFTSVSYVPTGASSVESVEFMESDSVIRLSQLYDSLGLVIKRLGDEYGDSADVSLHRFESRYYDIATEMAFMSQIVTKNLNEYNKNILNSSTILFDDIWWCMLCEIALNAAMTGSCAAIVSCTGGVAFWVCLAILDNQLTDYIPFDFICEVYFDCMNWFSAKHINVQSVYNTYTYKTGYIQDANDIRGDADGRGAMLFAGGPGDQAMIYVTLSEQYSHGYVEVRANSYTNMVSTLHVYAWNGGTNSWVLLSTLTILPIGYMWRPIGYTNLCFNELLFAVHNSGNSPSLVYIDAVYIKQ